MQNSERKGQKSKQCIRVVVNPIVVRLIFKLYEANLVIYKALLLVWQMKVIFSIVCAILSLRFGAIRSEHFREV